MTKPQASQVKIRSARLSLGFTVPQPEHVLLEGNHRSAVGELPAVAPGLVVELAPDLAEGGVGDVPGRRVVRELA